MDRRPHERCLNDAMTLEGLGQVLPAKAIEARPQTDVARWRVLHLDAAHLLEGTRDGERRTFEQELPTKQSPPELPLREDPRRCVGPRHTTISARISSQRSNSR
jgi:hypothetical protein